MSNPTPESAPVAARDLVFTHYATCMIAAALLPAPAHPQDHQTAEVTAAACVRILDGGGAPEGYVIPRYARQLEDVAQGEAVAEGARNPLLQNGRIMNAAEGAAFKNKVKASGPLPKKAAVEADNAAALARLAGISEPVRHAALNSSVARLTVIREGVRVEDAVAVIIEEIERAVRLADALGLDSKKFDAGKDCTIKEAIEGVPYPGNISLAIAIEAIATITDNDAPPAPGSDQPQAGA